MNKFKQPINIPYGKKKYELVEDYTYEWRTSYGIPYKIVVPKGFIYDGASIPRILWSISGLRPDGLIRAAALVHDWLYRHKGLLLYDSVQYVYKGVWLPSGRTFSRKEADTLFLNLMKDAGMSEYNMFIAHKAVRLFGIFSWRKIKV